MYVREAASRALPSLQLSQEGLGCDLSLVCEQSGEPGARHAVPARLAGICYLERQDDVMRKRAPGIGRPSKGDRHLFPLAQMPAEPTDAVLREAAARGLSQSEYLAVVISREHGLQMPWPPRTGPLLSTPRTHLDHPRLATRVPRAAADRVMDEAEARGMPYSRYVAAVVARAHGFDLPLAERLAPLQPEEAFSIGA